jgi:hypothetical protein
VLRPCGGIDTFVTIPLRHRQDREIDDGHSQKPRRQIRPPLHWLLLAQTLHSGGLVWVVAASYAQWHGAGGA